MNETPAQPPTLQVLQILTAAFMMSCVVLVVVAAIVASDAEGAGMGETVEFALCALGVVLVLVAPGVSRKIMAGLLSKTAPEARTEKEVLAAFNGSLIVGHALREAGTILGFVLSFTSGDLTYVGILCAVSLYGFFSVWPKQEHINAYLPLRNQGPG